MTERAVAAPQDSPLVASRLKRQARDRLARRSMGLITLAVCLFLPAIAVLLFVRSQPILSAKPIGELLFSSDWRPTSGAFGFYPFIMGTLWVTIVAMIVGRFRLTSSAG